MDYKHFLLQFALFSILQSDNKTRYFCVHCV